MPDPVRLALFAIPAAEGLGMVGKAAMEGGGAGGTTLLRTMKIGEDGLPVTGQSMTTLGARVPRDIPVGESGLVEPGTGGMSVTPKGGTLPNPGGRNLQTFCINCSDLGPNLRYVPDPSNPMNHGFIEPIRTMSNKTYQESLLQTRPFWKP